MITVDELPVCPVETTLMLINSRWKTLIINTLLDDGPKRFSELQRAIGHVSQKVLTQNLRQMESDGLIIRTVYAEVPPRVEYELTPLGQSLRPILDAMFSWGRGYQERMKKTA